jgi:hypothetical protein
MRTNIQSSMNEKSFREQVQKFLSWDSAHLDWKTALAGLPAKHRGVRPSGAPHSAWELLEHVRIAQWDLLEYSRNPKHVSPEFPTGYWPQKPAPPNAAAWDRSVKAFERDLADMGRLASDESIDLTAPIPGRSGETYLREILILADHNAYHLGQFVLLRRLLGAWHEK